MRTISMGVDRAVVVGVGFVEDQVSAFDENSCGWCDVRSADFEARLLEEERDVVFDGGEDSLGGGGIIEADGEVDIEDVLLG